MKKVIFADFAANQQMSEFLFLYNRAPQNPASFLSAGKQAQERTDQLIKALGDRSCDKYDWGTKLLIILAFVSQSFSALIGRQSERNRLPVAP